MARGGAFAQDREWVVSDVASREVSWQNQYFLTARNGQAARHSAEAMGHHGSMSGVEN